MQFLGMNPLNFKVSEFSDEQKFIIGMDIDQVKIFKKSDTGVFLVKLIAKIPEACRIFRRKKTRDRRYFKNKSL